MAGSKQETYFLKILETAEISISKDHVHPLVAIEENPSLLLAVWVATLSHLCLHLKVVFLTGVSTMTIL